MSESKDKTPKPYGRATKVAAAVIGMGLVASIAGNFQSIILEPGAPSIGAMISAVWWPALLFAMIELAIHTPWGDTALWRLVQWMGAGIIGGLAFYISYFHLAHVLSYFGYDIISRYAGPITVDVAMMVATLAMHRIGVAKRALATTEELAKADLAKAQELATMATEMAKDILATEPEPVATVATVATPPADDLATDWADLEDEMDRELAKIQNEARAAAAAPEPTEPATEAGQDAQDEAPAVKLTKVPALAAKRITEALESGASAAQLTALDEELAAEGIAGSVRTARRWRGAVTARTARVS